VARRSDFDSSSDWRYNMVTVIPLQPLVALLAGILILLMPRLLNYIVAVYLIIIGVVGLIR
jgi:hypothetical protein